MVDKPGPTDPQKGPEREIRLDRGNPPPRPTEKKFHLGRLDTLQSRLYVRAATLRGLAWASFAVFSVTGVLALLLFPTVDSKVVFTSWAGGIAGAAFVVLQIAFNAAGRNSNDADAVGVLAQKLVNVNLSDKNAREKIEEILSSAAGIIARLHKDHFEEVQGLPPGMHEKNRLPEDAPAKARMSDRGADTTSPSNDGLPGDPSETP